MFDGSLDHDHRQTSGVLKLTRLLFAGSHAAAENIVMRPAPLTYFATCHSNGNNPYQWLRVVLERVNATAPSQYHTLLPHLIDLNVEA